MLLQLFHDALLVNSNSSGKYYYIHLLKLLMLFAFKIDYCLSSGLFVIVAVS